MTLFEKIDLGVKIAIAVFTAFTSYAAFQWTQNLDERKFTQDQVDRVYDRFATYLSESELSDQPNESKCRLVAVYVKYVADSGLSGDLQKILDRSGSLCIEQAVTAVAVASEAPTSPQGLNDYIQKFVFGRNTEENSDVTVYVCDNASDIEATVKLAGQVGKAIADGKSFGSVDGSYWRGFDRIVPALNKLTFVIDRRFAEDTKVTEIINLLKSKSIDVTPAMVDNPGPATPWRTSVIACI